MPLSNRTNIYVDTTAQPADALLRRYENKYMAIGDVKCLGNGRTISRFYSPPERIRHIYDPSTLTAAEWTNAKAAAELPGETLVFETLLKEILESKPWYDLFYHRDFFGDPPTDPLDKKMIEGHPCYDTLVSYKVEYINIQVAIKASQALTLGGTAFLKDAVIATFVLIRPQDLIIEVNHKFNKECCDAPPANPPKEDESDSVDIATAARFMRAKFRTDTSATYTKHR